MEVGQRQIMSVAMTMTTPVMRGRANLAQNVEAALMSVCVCVGTARLRSPRGHWSLHHIVCAPMCGPVNSLP